MSKTSSSNTKPVLPWGAPSAILVAIGSYLVAQILASFTYDALPGFSLETISDSNVNLFILVAMVALYEFVVVSVYVNARGGTLKDLKIVTPRKSNLIKILPAYGIYFLLLLVITSISQEFLSEEVLNQAQDVGFSSGSDSLLELLLIFSALVIVAPAIEEIVFRGFMFRGLIKNGFNSLIAVTAGITAAIALFVVRDSQSVFQHGVTQDIAGESFTLAIALISVALLVGLLLRHHKVSHKLNVASAAIVSSGLFALAHFQINVGIDTFVLGVVSCALLYKSRSIWPSIGLHALKNAIAFVLIFVLEVSL